jgi:tight adherence protein C
MALARGHRVSSGHPPAFEVLPLPGLLRAGWAISERVRSVLSVPVPTGLATLLTRQLARAGLGGHVDAGGWVMLLASCAFCGIAASLLIQAWSGADGWAWTVLAALLPPGCAQSWLRSRAGLRASRLVRDLPATIDLLVLCLESGASIGTALRVVHDKSAAGPTRDVLTAIVQQIRMGRGRAEAFRLVMEELDLPPLTSVLTALMQAELRGMPLGPALRAQSVQRVNERFVRAERAALQAPVKLLLPLLLCIFPCTFIVIAVPIAARLTGQGGP